MRFNEAERALLRQGLIALDGDLRMQLASINEYVKQHPEDKLNNIEAIRKSWNDRIEAAAALLVRMINFEVHPSNCRYCTGTVAKHQSNCPENDRG